MERAGEVGRTTAADGTTLAWERHGRGPALLVLHGGGRAAKHYRTFAAALADRFTVVLMDRRGRAPSGPLRGDETLETEIGDLAAVMAATGSELVFGHSAGAVFALEAARRLPIRRLAVYEPPLVDDTVTPLGFLPAFEAALAKGRTPRAFVLLAQGLQMGLPAWMPTWFAATALGVALRGEARREMHELLLTVGPEIRMLRGGALRNSAVIGVPTLILTGTRSPPYLHRAAGLLRETIPGAQAETLEGLDHNAPDLNAPDVVAAKVRAFFDA